MPDLQSALRKLSLYRQAQSFYHRWYKKRRVKFYSEFVKQGNVCYDIGAHIGSRIDVFLTLGARVIAVEPQSSCFTLLEKKYSKNPNVVLLNEGLDVMEGTRTLYLSDSEALSSMSEKWIQVVKSSGRLAGHNWDRKEEVHVTTLDKLIGQYGLPDFCKIDVEGSELLVIKGLSKRIPFLSFEFNPEFRSQVADIMDHLDTLGRYSFNYSIGEDMYFRLSEWVNKDTLKKHSGVLSEVADVYARHVES